MSNNATCADKGQGHRGVQFHDEDEKALIEKFRQNGGDLFVTFRWVHGRREPLHRPSNPVVTKQEMKALSRLLRSGHVERVASGDWGWVRYRLKVRSAQTL